jgi:biopolymer transport protein ExbD
VRPLARRPGAAHAEDQRINVTPLIDVVMVMIVFFLIVGKLAADERSAIDLPDASAAARKTDADTLIINVDHEGTVILRGQSVPADRLDESLLTERTLQPALAVRIRADRTLTYAAIQPVIQACRAAGITSVRLAAADDGSSEDLGP